MGKEGKQEVLWFEEMHCSPKPFHGCHVGTRGRRDDRATNRDECHVDNTARNEAQDYGEKYSKDVRHGKPLVVGPNVI